MADSVYRKVIGASPVGSPPIGAPLVIGALDPTGKLQFLQVDSQGNLVTSGAGGFVGTMLQSVVEKIQGAGTVGAAEVGSPVLLGALDPSGNVQVLSVDASGNLKTLSSGGGGSYLQGTAFGTSGLDAGTVTNINDGNIATATSTPNANGEYVGIDLGAQHKIGAVAIWARQGAEPRAAQAGVYGANLANLSDKVLIYTTPNETLINGQQFYYAFPGPVGPYRYIQLLPHAGNFCDFGEMAIYVTT